MQIDHGLRDQPSSPVAFQDILAIKQDADQASGSQNIPAHATGSMGPPPSGPPKSSLASFNSNMSELVSTAILLGLNPFLPENVIFTQYKVNIDHFLKKIPDDQLIIAAQNTGKLADMTAAHVYMGTYMGIDMFSNLDMFNNPSTEHGPLKPLFQSNLLAYVVNDHAKKRYNKTDENYAFYKKNASRYKDAAEKAFTEIMKINDPFNL
jgi:hypothetical protein